MTQLLLRSGAIPVPSCMKITWKTSKSSVNSTSSSFLCHLCAPIAAAPVRG